METLQRLHNRGSISTDTAYNIDNSVKLEPDNTEYLSRTIGSTSNRKTFTVSCWFKRTELKAGAADANGHNLFFSGVDSTNMVSMQFHTWQDTNADKLEFRVVGSTNNYTSRRFRDTSAWYHIVLAVDTTQATESNRWKLYVNGVQETAFDATSYPSQNADTVNNVANNVMRIGTKPYGGNEFGYFAGYIADYYHIDGEALAPTDFGEFDEDSGIWKPKAYTGSFGTNGWYLDFVDGSDLGDDESGNGNDFTENNIAAADQATDTPTNNFCTWSPLWTFYRNSTITDGGTVVAGAAGGWSHAGPTMGVMNGRWYWEWKITNSDVGFISFSTLEGNLNLNQLAHDNAVIMGYGAGHLYTWLNGVQGSNESTGWGTWAVNDIIGIYLDLENSDRRFTLYKNGSAISGSTSFPVSFPNAMQVANGGGNIFPYNVQYENDGGEWNFGGYTTMSNTRSYSDANGYGSFVYSPVLSGVNYYSLCTKNLAEYG